MRTLVITRFTRKVIQQIFPVKYIQTTTDIQVIEKKGLDDLKILMNNNPKEIINESTNLSIPLTSVKQRKKDPPKERIAKASKKRIRYSAHKMNICCSSV